MLTLRPYQREALDALYGYWRDGGGNALIVLPTGCHAPGTMILMYDGSSKKVEDVIVGDVLMGDDSGPRLVKRLFRGRESMYRITPKKGEPFIVNQNHILSLKTTNEGKSYPSNTTAGNVENVSVAEYLGKSKYWKHLRKLWRTGVFFQPHQSANIPAWIVGTLLGDGSLGYGHLAITSPDHEVLDEVCNYMEAQGLRCRITEKRGCWTVNFADDEASCSIPNRVTAKIRKLGINVGSGDKFIPDIFKFGSRHERLEVLAGLMDTDGHYDNIFDFISKSKRLAHDVCFVARSLGLYAQVTECQKGYEGFVGTYWRVGISGNLEIIPTRVKRKQASPRRQKKNHLVTGFDIQAIGEGEFFGFELDNNHLYLTADFIVHHNSGKSLVLAALCQELLASYPTLRIAVVTHIRELIQQNFLELLRLWPEAPAGIYSAGIGRRDARAKILFCGIQSVHNKTSLLGAIDVLLVDECHLIPRNTDTTYGRFITSVRADTPDCRVVGLTATPYRMSSGRLDRGEGRIFDQIVYDANVADLIEQDYLSPIISKATAQQLDVTGVAKRGGEYVPGALEIAVDRDWITRNAAEEIARFGVDRKAWLVFCSGVMHAEHVRDAIRLTGASCEMVVGETPSHERDRFISQFRAGKIRCLTSVGVLGTGFNVPHVDMIALLRPTQSAGLFVQQCGRGLRKAPGKKNCLILDFSGLTLLHGPIDQIATTGNGSDKVAGDPLAKECPKCATLVALAARQCPDCGYEWPPRDELLPRHEATADAHTSIISKGRPVWVDVNEVRYYRHEKPGSPASLRAEYHCGLTVHREWVCLSHNGFARQKAEAWWQRVGQSPIPRNTEDAMTRVGELRSPSQIQVRPDGKFFQITARRFEMAKEEACLL